MKTKTREAFMGTERYVHWVAALLIGALMAGCQEPQVLDDLSDASFRLISHDSTAVDMPDDFAGDVMVVGYIYTHCPDVCPQITSNMKQVREQLGAPDDVQFVTVTFDPRRDTPSRLREYRAAYNLDGTSWQFLTGDSTAVSSFLDRMNIYHVPVPPSPEVDSLAAIRNNTYLVTHSNQITLIDQQGRVRDLFNGSRTPPEEVVDAINAIR